MAKTYPARLNGQVAFQDWFTGLQEDAQHYTSQWSNVKESTFAGGAVGDGVTDDTAAIAAAFADADSTGRAVFLPPGTYKTHPIDYRMQSYFGTHMDKCAFLSFPGEDIFQVNATIGQFYRKAGTIHDISWIVDDSVDAAASFPNRGGVGNAAYANDYNDKAAAAPPSTIDWQYYNLKFKATSTTVGGRNNSCGIYTQSNHLTQFRANGMAFENLRYGWRDHWPNLNFTHGVTSFSRDHPQVNFLHFLRCGYQWRADAWGFGEVSNIMFHGGPSIVDLDCNWNNMHVAVWEMVGDSTTQNFFTAPTNYKNEYAACSISSNVQIVWNESDSIFSGNINVPPIALPWMQINGNRNRFYLTQVDAAATNYGYNYVLDLGVGNIVEGGERGSTAQFRRTSMTRAGGRIARKQDSHSGFLGIVDPMFVSSDDLLITPRDLKLASGLGSSYDYIVDANAEFGECFRRNSTALTLDTNLINGIAGFMVGKFLPATKIRVYVKCKLATAGTLTWFMQVTPPGGANVGQITNPAVGTSYTVISWDVDLTGQADGTLLRLATGNIAGGGANPIDIAWIMFRPWANDWPVMRLRGSADNGDASKTLVVSDLEKQRFNTVLTANRTVTLPTANVPDGHTFRIIREATATGAFNLTVNPGTLKVLATASTWVDLYYDLATALWHVSAAGAL